MKPIYRPLRLLWLVPIFWMCSQFQDQNLVLWFSFIMSFITVKIFPWVETPPPPKKDQTP